MRLIAFLFLLSAFASCQKECPTCEKPEECVVCEVPEECADSCKVDLTKGLLAYYPFNGSFNDASGNGNNGVATNGAYLSTGFLGRANTAAAFDGNDDYIIVNDNGKLSSDSVTVSLWVVANTINRMQSIVTRANFENTAAVSWGVGQSLVAPNRWEFGVAKSSDDCQKLHVYDASIYCNSTQSINPGQWYHVLATFVNGVQKIYIDGVLKGTLTRDFKTLKKCSNAQFIIGGWWKGGINSIDGKIDEVRIYNRGLSDCEIKELSLPK